MKQPLHLFSRNQSKLIIGGINSCVTKFAFLAGVTGAHFRNNIIIVLGVPSLFEDGFSMSVGSCLSSKVESQNYQKNINAEYWSVENKPGVTFLPFFAVGLISQALYVIDLVSPNLKLSLFLISSILTFCAFILIGYLKAHLNQVGKIKGIFETLFMSGIAAFVAFLAGNVLEKLRNKF